MLGRPPDRRERFARNWKLIGIPSKSKWRGNLLNNRILTLAMSRLMNKFQAQTLPVIEDVCYELGKEDSNQLIESLNVDKNNARSCLQPIEMVCLLNGVDAEIISEKKINATLKVTKCPLSDVLVGIVPNDVICRNYFRGMAQAVNQNARIMLPKKKCQDNEHCEFIITLSI